MQAHDGELTIARHGAEVRAALVLPGRAPAAALAAFTEPELLKRWWPGVEVTPRDGEVEGHLEGWEFFLPRLPRAV